MKISSINLSSLACLAVPVFAAAQFISTSTTTITLTSTISGASPTEILAQGILRNIDIQVHELAYVQLLLADVTATTPLNTTAYLANKASLLAVQSSGVAIRESNQAIAPAGNAAIPGLSVVAGAQQTEIALANALSGNIVSTIPSDHICLNFNTDWESLLTRHSWRVLF